MQGLARADRRALALVLGAALVLGLLGWLAWGAIAEIYPEAADPEARRPDLESADDVGERALTDKED